MSAGRKKEAMKILTAMAKMNKSQVPDGELCQEMQVMAQKTIVCLFLQKH